VGAGLWQLEEIPELVRIETRFEPVMSPAERERLASGWRRAVERARGWAKEVGG
jgi:glycerol kinase